MTPAIQPGREISPMGETPHQQERKHPGQHAPGTAGRERAGQQRQRSDQVGQRHDETHHDELGLPELQVARPR